MREPGASIGGVVLAGGRSQRMGTAKAALEWHGSTLAFRVAGLLARAVDGPVVVVRAPGQPLPRLPAGVEVAEDAREGRGPLQGIAAGLRALDGRAAAAYVAAVDAPLLHPAFVTAVAATLGEDDVALPVISGYRQPLAAVYRVDLWALVEEAAAGDRRGTGALFARCRVRELDGDALPHPETAGGLNDRAAYHAARAAPAPLVTVAGRGPARAATLGALDLQGPVLLNGRPVDPEPELPLAEGDRIAFGPAAPGSPA